VVIGVCVLALLPAAVGHLPRARNPLSAAELLHRIQHSKGTAYSGYAESAGTLALPVTTGVGSLADLLGQRTTMRVWWRSATDWRVDQVAPFGEVDTHRTGAVLATWNYESNRVEYDEAGVAGAMRMPVAADLLPPELGRRLLSEARDGEVVRRPVRRVANVDAPGLRLSGGPASSIEHVDVYADPATGLPLEVDVYGRNAPGVAAVSTSFLDLSVAMPARATTSFEAPAGAAESDGASSDSLSTSLRFGFARVPTSLAGLPSNARGGGAGVGIYGRGVTQLVAVPLGWESTWRLSDQLTNAGSIAHTACSVAAVCAGRGGTRQEATVGPLSVLLLRDPEGHGWALTGTVVPATLRTAANELLAWA
jgi:hypothetical protein